MVGVGFGEGGGVITKQHFCIIFLLDLYSLLFCKITQESKLLSLN